MDLELKREIRTAVITFGGTIIISVVAVVLGIVALSIVMR